MWWSRRLLAGHPLLAADEVLELHRVADEEHRGVVADHVEVALGGVELQRESARVAPGVWAAPLARHRGEADHHLGLGAGLEHRRLGVPADVVGHLEVAERAATLGVRLPLRDALPVEVGHLLDQVVVLQQDRAVGADGQRVFDAGYRGAGIGGRELLSHIGSSPRDGRPRAVRPACRVPEEYVDPPRGGTQSGARWCGGGVGTTRPVGAAGGRGASIIGPPGPNGPGKARAALELAAGTRREHRRAGTLHHLLPAVVVEARTVTRVRAEEEAGAEDDRNDEHRSGDDAHPRGGLVQPARLVRRWRRNGRRAVAAAPFRSVRELVRWARSKARVNRSCPP